LWRLIRLATAFSSLIRNGNLATFVAFDFTASASALHGASNSTKHPLKPTI